MTNPLQSLIKVRREELPLSLLMFSYFFLVITSFWVLKPVKSAIFIEFYDQTGFDFLTLQLTAAQAELLAKILNMVVAFVAVIAFTLLSRRLQRQRLTYVFMAFFLAGYIFYSFGIDAPSDGTVWTFYLFGDLWTTLMVTTFFAFLNDSVTPGGAKRMYGLVVLGGVVGGAFGSTFVRVWIASLATSHWLWICFGMGVAIMVVAGVAGRLVERNPPPVRAAEAQPEVKSSNPALEGARLVLRSPYLLSIVTIVGLYEITSQVLDFQFKATISHYLDGPEIGRQMTTIYAISNWVSMLVQLFLTNFLMNRYRLNVSLLVLPAAIALGSGCFLAFPILWIGSLLNTADSGFAYSINQSAKEALYVPTSREEKYRAKAFIDMFIQRFAKVLAIGVSLATTTYFTDFSSVQWLALFTLLIVAVWGYAAVYAGKRFEALSERVQPDAPTSEVSAEGR